MAYWTVALTTPEEQRVKMLKDDISHLSHLAEENLPLFVIQLCKQVWVYVHITQYLLQHRGGCK